MKLQSSWAGIVFAFAGGFTVLAASGGTALLQLQKAPTVAGPWQALPASPALLTPDGGLADPQTNSGFYRLKITTTDVAGGALAMPLGTVSTQALQQAQAMLAGNTGAGWGGGAMLAPYAYPVYDLSINAGKSPAYLEFKVMAPTAATGQFPTAPVELNVDLGYILVSLTTQDVPVPEMGQLGPTRVEQLRQLAQATSIKPVRYGHGLWVAEDSAGNAVATIGSMPYRLSQQLLSVVGAPLGGQVVSNTVFADTGPLQANDTGPYDSYAQFRQDYATGAVHSYLHARRAEAGKFRWNLEADILPPIIVVPLGGPTQVLPTVPLTSFELEDPSVASGKILAAAAGISITGLTPGGTILHVLLTDGTTAYYALQVGNGGVNVAKGWTSWSYWWAGGCSDQRRYYQETGVSGCSAGCYDGCGPTAWALLYGWWDYRGLCTLIGDCSATPLYNDSNVRACMGAECGYVGAYCAFGQGATWPWNEGNGWHWAPTRSGRGISESWNWGVPGCLCSACRNQAKNAVQAGRVAIIGTGVYNHYPLAWGYAYREYRLFGITWSTSSYWAVNEGWGGASCPYIWANTDDCWFGNNTTCY